MLQAKDRYISHFGCCVQFMLCVARATSGNRRSGNCIATRNFFSLVFFFCFFREATKCLSHLKVFLNNIYKKKMIMVGVLCLWVSRRTDDENWHITDWMCSSVVKLKIPENHEWPISVCCVVRFLRSCNPIKHQGTTYWLNTQQQPCQRNNCALELWSAQSFRVSNERVANNNFVVVLFPSCSLSK